MRLDWRGWMPWSPVPARGRGGTRRNRGDAVYWGVWGVLTGRFNVLTAGSWRRVPSPWAGVCARRAVGRGTWGGQRAGAAGTNWWASGPVAAVLRLVNVSQHVDEFCCGRVLAGVSGAFWADSKCGIIIVIPHLAGGKDAASEAPSLRRCLAHPAKDRLGGHG